MTGRKLADKKIEITTTLSDYCIMRDALVEIMTLACDIHTATVNETKMRKLAEEALAEIEG